MRARKSKGRNALSFMDRSGPLDFMDQSGPLNFMNGGDALDFMGGMGQEDFSTGRVPFIAGVTDGDQNRQLEYRLWQMKSPQERFAASEMGRMVGASPLASPGDPGSVHNWAQGNSYWAGLAKNIATGSDLPTARLPRYSGVEGENTSPNVGQQFGDGMRNIYDTLAGGTKQTQTLEGIKRGALASKDAQDLARAAESGDEEAGQKFFDYIRNTYGISGRKEIQSIFDLLRGRP